MNPWRLLARCPDARGLVAALAGALAELGGNVTRFGEHVTPDTREFLARVEVALPPGALPDLEARLAGIASATQLSWRLVDAQRKPRVALLCSKQLHCLADLLERHASGEWVVDLPVVISNHPDAAPLVRFHGLPFVHLPIQPGRKAKQEARLLEVLAEHRVDWAVMARYMQILSPELLGAYPGRILNIHHGLLPAFKGGKPYHQAFDRGVKLIGATAHVATEDLDEGPIIAQDVVRVGLADAVEDLVRKGRDVERVVLARAARLMADDRVFVVGHRTVVFED